MRYNMLLKLLKTKSFVPRRSLCDVSSHAKVKDPGNFFFRKDVQDVLKRVTGFNLDKIFQEKFTKVKPPKYKLLTDEELEQLQADTIRRGRRKLQMPPVVQPRTSEEEILSQDPEIEGHDPHRFVFTDITYGINDKTRTIVVREPCGNLRLANSDERDRLVNVYFPKPGRMYHLPKMFTDPHLTNVLEQQKYKYVLDRAAVQFEPDSHHYIRVCEQTYDYIAAHNDFDLLRSTRHFGPMAFYFALNHKMERLVVDMIQRDLINDAADMVRMHNIIHRDTKSSELRRTNPEVSPQQLVQTFAESDTAHGGKIELALQAYLEAHDKANAEAVGNK